MKRIAVYGSLREGEYNYDRCIPGAEVIAQVILPGWTMYDLGYGFPAIVKGNRNVVFDIMDITEEQYELVESMELGAGYRKEDVLIGMGNEEFNATVFYMEREPGYSEGVIETGDWNKHRAERARRAVDNVTSSLWEA